MLRSRTTTIASSSSPLLLNKISNKSAVVASTIFTSKRFGLNHDPSNQGLSDATVQFSMFASNHAVDAVTGLSFPWHVQRLLDNEAAKCFSASSSSSVKMNPNLYNVWVDDRWATEIKKCKLNNNNNDSAGVSDEASSTTTSKKIKKTSASKKKSNNSNKKDTGKNKKNNKQEEGSSNSSNSLTSASVQVSPWKYSGTTSSSLPNSTFNSTLRHISAFSVTDQQVADYEKSYAEEIEKKKKSQQNSSSSSSSYSTPEVNKAEEPEKKLTKDELLQKLLRPSNKNALPRCGQTGSFFTRQDLAFSLVVSGELKGFKSPFWISTEHPGLETSFGKNPKEPHLKIKPSEIDNFTLASASLIVFPAKRLAMSDSALEQIFSPSFTKVRGSPEASGMNAISGVKLESTFSVAVREFFAKEHPEFEKDGWVSFDQVMKFGLPLRTPVGKGGPRGVAVVPDDLFDGGVLVPILKDVKYFNQEQLERPGKLAMKRMPGAPPSLLS